MYIDDLVEGMFDLLEGKEQHCEFDGVETVLKEDGRYCCVPVTHKVTLGEIVDLLKEFKKQPTTLMMPKMPDGSFAKKLYSLYLTYLPTDKFKYALKMNMDNRGSFTELVHTGRTVDRCLSTSAAPELRRGSTGTTASGSCSL